MGEPQPNPMRLGKYQVKKKIGVGGMAEIYLASLISDPNSHFAIKRILSPYANNEHLVSMLVNEAQVSASLRHPNIVPIYDFGRVDDSYYLAMEFVAGKDLKSIIYACRRSGHGIPIDIALYIIMEVLEGLSYAHKKKDNFNRPLEIVHRDMSPQNIMVANDGTVKILDFGIAKVRGKAAETQAGILKGKFSYMSPEQARGDRIDRRTDIFSAGITLYELLTLENPFFYDSELETLNHVKKARFQSPRLLNRKVPKSLEKVVKKAMQRKRYKRYSWTEEMQKDIARIQRDEVGTAGPADLQRFLRKVLHGDETTGEIELTEKGLSDEKRYSFESSDNASDIYYISILQQKRRKRIIAALVFFSLLGVGSSWIYRDRLNVASIKQLANKLLFPTIEQPSQPNEEPVETTNQEQSETVAANTLGDDIEVRYTGKAAKYLDQLPFEKYEITRNGITDAISKTVAGKTIDEFSGGKVLSLKTGNLKVAYRLLLPQEVIEVISIQN